MTEDKQLVTEGKKSGDRFFNILAIVVGFIIASVLGYFMVSFLSKHTEPQDYMVTSQEVKMVEEVGFSHTKFPNTTDVEIKTKEDKYHFINADVRFYQTNGKTKVILNKAVNSNGTEKYDSALIYVNVDEVNDYSKNYKETFNEKLEFSTVD